MKIKSNQYGVFYKDNGKWIGPADGVVATKAQIENGEYVEAVRKDFKKKVRVFRQIWKSVKS